jgi:hypothetical protein
MNKDRLGFANGGSKGVGLVGPPSPNPLPQERGLTWQPSGLFYKLSVAATKA